MTPDECRDMAALLQAAIDSAIAARGTGVEQWRAIGALEGAVIVAVSRLRSAAGQQSTVEVER